MPQITILWDTSGSMGGEHNAILVEVVSILEETSAPIRVVTCDTQVRGETNTRDIAEIVTVVEGGGGSDFNPAFEYVAPSLTWDTIIIAMTDGHINVPKEAPACQASLWLLTPDGVDPTGGRWGDVIRLDRP
jgi:predicted metal-dependent peptidase